MKYEVLYAAAWVNAAVGAVAGVLAAAYPVAHPAWLSSDLAATCALIVTVTLVLAALLPAVHRTPMQREGNYLAALAGVLPDDIAKKHGVDVIPPPTEKPFDTL